MEEVHGPNWRNLVRQDAPDAPVREPVTEPGPDGPAEEQEDGRSAAGSSEFNPVAELLARLAEPYDPDIGPFEPYRERARRIVQQLQVAGETVDVRAFQKRMYREEYRAETHGLDIEEKRRWLRGLWKDLVTGEAPHSVEELPDRLEIVDELCREAGDDPTAWAARIGGGRGSSAAGTATPGMDATPPREAVAAGNRGSEPGARRGEPLFPDGSAGGKKV